MQYHREIKITHEEIQKKLFSMLPEKWERVYLYASVIEHFNKLQTGEMFFYYFPKGLLRKNPINVYEVPSKFNIDEKQYFRLADDLYYSIKKLRELQIELGEPKWSNITIAVEGLKYKAIYNYEDITTDNIAERRIIWTYRYLKLPYESFGRKERKAIDKYKMGIHIPEDVFELSLYSKSVNKKLGKEEKIEQRMEFVTEEKIKEMEFKNTHKPKSQILN